MPAKNWVSYAAVKDAIPIERVLERLGHPFSKKPDGRIEATCPIHKGTHARQFKTTANGRGFKCFACGSKGNLLDLVAALEGIEIRDAALKLAEWFPSHAATPCGVHRELFQLGRRDDNRRPRGASDPKQCDPAGGTEQPPRLRRPASGSLG